jgi:hypothetical protein
MTSKNGKKRFSTAAFLIGAIAIAIAGSVLTRAARSEALMPRINRGQGAIIVGSVPMADDVVSPDEVKIYD